MSSPKEVMDVADRLEAVQLASEAADQKGEDEGKEVIVKQCASCGKASSTLKRCTACKSVWYCNVSCQKAHRKIHKKECKCIEKELKLFADPPPRDECSICMITLPLEKMMSSYMSCCGALICSGCCFSQTNRAKEEGLIINCAHCRAPYPDSKELLSRYRARAEKNDPNAIWNLAAFYETGKYECPIDSHKALELYEKAVSLSSAEACNSLAIRYMEGALGLGQDYEKARMYWEMAAMAGDPYSHANLGNLEGRSGNFLLAIRHWRFAAAAGVKFSVDKLDVCCQTGLISSSEAEESRRAWHKASKEMWSEDRDQFVRFMRELGECNDERFEYAFEIGAEHSSEHGA